MIASRLACSGPSPIRRISKSWPSSFKSRAASKKTGMPFSANDVGKICFAYVGRLVTEKSIPVFLEAARLLKEEGHDFEIRLIGDGPEHANLEAIIARDHLNGYVHITGYL